MLQRVMYSIT